MQAEEFEKDRLRGAAEAYEYDGAPGWANHMATMREERGEHWAYGFEMTSAGIAGQNAGMELLAQSQNVDSVADFDAIVTPLAQGLNEALDGVGPEAKAEAMKRLRAAEMQQRQLVMNKEEDRNYGITLANNRKTTQFDLNMLADDHSREEIYNILQDHKARDTLSGVATEDTNDGIVELLGNLAVTRRDPSVLNVLEYDNPDGTPGLAFAEEHGAKVRDWATKAVDARNSDQNTAKQLAILDASNHVDGLIREGKTEEAKVYIRDRVGDGTFSGSKAVTMQGEVDKEAKEAADAAKMANSLLTGDNLSGIKDTDKQKGLDKMLDDLNDRVSKVDTPEAQAEALQVMLYASANTNMLPTAHKDMLSNLNPNNPEALAETMQLSTAYQTYAPGAYNTLPEAQRMAINSVRRKIQQGADQQAIAEHLMTIKDPEWKAARADLKNTDGYKDARGELRGKLESTGGFLGIANKDMTNYREAEGRISETALDYHQKMGGDMEEAFEYATEMFMGNYVPVTQGNDKYRWVFRGKGHGPADLGDMLSAETEAAMEKLQAREGYMEGDSVTLVPDPMGQIYGERQYVFVNQNNEVMMEEDERGQLQIRRVPESQLVQRGEDRKNAAAQAEVDRRKREEEMKIRSRRAHQRAKNRKPAEKQLPDDFMPPYNDPGQLPDDFIPEGKPDDFIPGGPVNQPAPTAPPGPYGAEPQVNREERKIRLVKEIFEGEGTNDAQARRNGFNSGYDVPYGYGKYAKPNKPLTEMSIAELKKFQAKQIGATKGTIPGTEKGTGAVGKYQVTQGTLKMAQDALGFKESDRFSPELQDRIGAYLLDKRGYTKYVNGEITAEQFQTNLSMEWASVADPATGKSRYGQATGTSLEELEAALNL
jgi:hypothetical protein